MIVGVPNETNTNETRAAIIPPVAEELVDLRRNIRSFSVVFFGAHKKCWSYWVIGPSNEERHTVRMYRRLGANVTELLRGVVDDRARSGSKYTAGQTVTSQDWRCSAPQEGSGRSVDVSGGNAPISASRSRFHVVDGDRSLVAAVD